jgi:hypothetical protein
LPGLALNFLTCASWVGRIIGMSHQCPVNDSIFIIWALPHSFPTCYVVSLLMRQEKHGGVYYCGAFLFCF